MKKTYISPELVTVELHTKTTVLLGSKKFFEDTIVEESDGGWIKENVVPITDTNLWDDEW